jgi:hypothetical protein
MKKLILIGITAIAVMSTAHAGDRYIYTINVPNQEDGSPGFLNVRTVPKGQIIGSLAHSYHEDKYGDVDTTVIVLDKKGDWWYVDASNCDKAGLAGWVNKKFLVEHKASDECGC